MNRLIPLCCGGIAFGICVSSCVTSLDTTNRHRNRTEVTPVILDEKYVQRYARVDVSSFTVVKPTTPATPIAKPSPLLVTSLAPEAQQELIKTLSANTKPASLLKILGSSLPSTETPPSLPPSSFSRIIPKQVTKRFVMAINLPIDGTGLADRLTEIQYSIYLGKEPAIFSSWEIFESKYGSINLGKVSSSSGMDLKTQVDAKVGGETSTVNAGPSVGASFSKKYETSKDLSGKLLIFSGILHDKEVIFNQRGEEGNNIEGNNSVIIECETTDDWAKPLPINKISNLYAGKNQRPVSPDSLKLARGLIMFPDAKQDIIGKFKYKFSYRQIIGGGRSAAEAKQRIAIKYGELDYPKDNPAPSDLSGSDSSITRTIVLFRKKDFRPVTYQITDGKDNLILRSDKLNFDTPNEALEFLDYLYKYFQRKSTVNSSLKLGTLLVTSKNLSSLQVKTIEDN